MHLSQMSSKFKGLSLIQLLIGITGLGTAIYAHKLHLEIIEGQGGMLSCDINDTFSCTDVIGSIYGEIFGISLGAFGASFWAIVIMITLLPLIIQSSLKWISGWRLFVGTIGMISAIILYSIATFIIKKGCVVCLTTQGLCLLYFISTLVGFFLFKKETQGNDDKAFFKLSFLTTLCGILPLIAGYTHAYQLHQAQPQGTSLSEIEKVPSDLKEIEAPIAVKDEIYLKTGNFSVGPAQNPKMVITLIGDFQCPACRIAHRAIHSYLEKHDPKHEHILLIYREVALNYHSEAINLGNIVRCAGEQGAYETFANWAFALVENYERNFDQTALSKAITPERIRQVALQAGIHVPTLFQCREQNKHMERFNQNYDYTFKTLQATGTPVVLVNQKTFKGASWNELEAMIEEATKK